MNDYQAIQQALIIMNAHQDGLRFDLVHMFRHDIFKSYDAVYQHLIDEMLNKGYVEHVGRGNYRITLAGRNAIDI